MLAALRKRNDVIDSQSPALSTVGAQTQRGVQDFQPLLVRETCAGSVKSTSVASRAPNTNAFPLLIKVGFAVLPTPLQFLLPIQRVVSLPLLSPLLTMSLAIPAGPLQLFFAVRPVVSRLTLSFACGEAHC